MKDYIIGLLLNIFILLALVFLIIKYIYPYLKRWISTYKIANEINKIAEIENISYEEAKAIFISRLVENTFTFDKSNHDIDGISIEKGDYISFQDETQKYIRGQILGFKESKAEGYTYHYGIKSQDNKVIFKPVETIVGGTLNIINKNKRG